MRKCRKNEWVNRSMYGPFFLFPYILHSQPSIQRAFQPTASFVHSLAPPPPPPMSRFQDQNLNEVLARSLPRGGEIVLLLLLLLPLLLIFAALLHPFLSPSNPRRCFRSFATSRRWIQIARSRPEISIAQIPRNLYHLRY